MSEVIESVELRYQEGTSDKVYHVSIETAGGGYVVNFAYGRRGSALNTGTKTPQALTLQAAESVYRKLVQSKTAKDYRVHSGADERAIPVARDQGRDTGLRPQLCNAVTEKESEALVRNDVWCAQEKYDGRRMLVRKAGDGTVTAANRKGQAIACPESVAAALNTVRGPFTADGELMGDRYWVFDLLESPQGDLRHSAYSERLAQLEHVLGRVSGVVEVAPTVFGSSAKRAFAEGLRQANKEGVVFKDLGACWTEGKLASGGPALKLKFWETCSCVVLRVNAGKRSVELGLGGRSVGNVTIPPNFEVPTPGQVVEIRYLYVAAQGGSLYQPLFLGVRDDIDADECTEDAQQLKYRAAA